MTTATGPLASRRFRRRPGTIIEPLRGLDDGRGAEGFFGIAATPGRAEPRLIDPDTALLLYSLEEPGVLPHFAAVDLLRHNARELLALIAESMIEIELDGTFVTGEQAMRELVTLPKTESPAAELNRAVMKHALRVTNARPSELRDALYFANAEPADGSTQGLDLAPGPVGRWITKPHESWIMFHRAAHQGDRLQPGGWKLYFSPRSAQLPDLIDEIADAFDQCRAAQWKVGRHAQGMLRPDKVVGYFANRNDLVAAINHFVDRFVVPGEIDAHGIPFAVPGDPTGLIAWGVDPNQASDEPVSWRYALCELLANWMASTDPTIAIADRVDHALRICAAEGFDTQTFEPPPVWLKEAEVTL